MALRLEEKKQVVATINEVASQASSLVLADFTGISVAQMTEIRKEASENQVRIFVLHNRLTKKALLKTPYEFLTDQLQGPCVCGFSMGHPRMAAKIFQEKMKRGKVSSLKGAAFDGRWISADHVSWLANLPTREEALSKLLGVFKELVGGKFARVLSARKAQLQCENVV